GMERYYTTALTYVGAPSADELDDRCDPDVLRFYSMATADVDAKTYTITATPIGKQSGDSCGTLSLDQAGTKSPATPGCWRSGSAGNARGPHRRGPLGVGRAPGGGLAPASPRATATRS